MLEPAPLADVAHLEGIVRGSDGDLYGADEGGGVFRIDVFRIDRAGAGATHVATVPGLGLGHTGDAHGRLFVCTTGPERVTRVDPVSGACETWCETAGGAAMICRNDPVFGADGTLYVSDSGSEALGAGGGRMLAVPPDSGDAAVIADGLTSPTALRSAPTGRCT